jgi:hypothetical protein
VSAAENWLDVVGQMFWPSFYLVYACVQFGQGFEAGSIVACSEQITNLCGTGFFQFAWTDW